jgi:hypothetical protein
MVPLDGERVSERRYLFSERAVATLAKSLYHAGLCEFRVTSVTPEQHEPSLCLVASAALERDEP